jgi:hypothetical protein
MIVVSASGDDGGADSSEFIFLIILVHIVRSNRAIPEIFALILYISATGEGFPGNFLRLRQNLPYTQSLAGN